MLTLTYNDIKGDKMLLFCILGSEKVAGKERGIGSSTETH